MVNNKQKQSKQVIHQSQQQQSRVNISAANKGNSGAEKRAKQAQTPVLNTDKQAVAQSKQKKDNDFTTLLKRVDNIVNANKRFIEEYHHKFSH